MVGYSTLLVLLFVVAVYANEDSFLTWEEFKAQQGYKFSSPE